MIRKYIFLSLAILIFVTASDPFFGIELSFKPLPKEERTDVTERLWMSTDAFRPYLMDYENKVSDLFPVTPYYYPNVHFWFLIYTQFESSSVVIHDKSDLSIIYKVLDFSSLHEKKLPLNTIYVLQEKISEEKVKSLKNDLEDLAKDPFSYTPEAKNILRTLKQANVTLPTDKSERSILFAKLKKNLRTQTGQKNFIRNGIVQSLPYQTFFNRYFTDKKLPKELVAIPFLESSFNPHAHSKVSAVGVWQFMPLIASYFIPKRTKFVDYRSNVGVSSLAAGFLLAENFQIMKSWDLAVTAYNSGTKHLLKTKRELGSSNVDLEAIIKHSDSEHFGFASKNFYSEFLALVHTLAYREELFTDLHTSDREDVDVELKYYLTKCPIRLPGVLNDKLMSDLQYHNHHISRLKGSLPRGLILTTKSPLPSAKFLPISYKDLLKMKPKDWGKILKNQSCSTR